ncbi:unnamed protein product, partial [marine sediment metagenome]
MYDLVVSTPEPMRKYVQENTIDLGEQGKDKKTGYGFFTLESREFDLIKSQLFGWSNQDLSW